MDKAVTCCFTGHRKLSEDRIESIIKRLDREIDNLIGQSVTDFISGGALGFDQIAASLVLEKRNAGSGVRLILALPCKNQDRYWTDEQKRRYRELIDAADEVVYVSEGYSADCMEKRNRWMVERSDFCICALLYSRSGTGQTVRYAREMGLWVVNMAKNIDHE